jgi:hypothetical protein
MIAAYEFCALVQLNKIIPLFCVPILFPNCFIKLLSVRNRVILSDNFGLNTRLDVDIKLLNTTLLLITLFSIKCIFFLFDDNVQSITKRQNLYLLIIVLPFYFITKYHLE